MLIPREPIKWPNVVEGLVFDGTVQTGVVEGDGYALAGTCAAREAGAYQATATPTVGCCWPDGTHDPVRLSWSIARRSVTVRAAASSKVVGEEEPVYRTVDEGFVDGDDVEATWTIWRTNLVAKADGTLGLDETVGVYDLCVTGEVELANYAITYVNGIGDFEILKGAPSIPEAEGRIEYDPATKRATVTPDAGTNAVEIVDLPREATVVVPSRIDTVKGADPGQLVVVSSSEAASSPSCDITGAFRIGGNRVDGVSIVLSDDPDAAVAVPVGDRTETIRVKPELTDSGDEVVEPLTVSDGEVGLGAKTIPGLRYLLRRSLEPADAQRGDVVDSKRAETTRTKLSDSMSGDRPDRAFYVIEVTK